MALSDYITSTLGSIATVADWVVADTTFVINNTLLNYGVATEVEATDLIKLHALADIEIYKKALAQLSTKYNFSADGGTFNRNQMFESVKTLYLDAVTAGSHYSVVSTIGTGELTDNTTPYKNIDLSNLQDYGGVSWAYFLP